VCTILQPIVAKSGGSSVQITGRDEITQDIFQVPPPPRRILTHHDVALATPLS
jgi:hypothetical protein